MTNMENFGKLVKTTKEIVSYNYDENAPENGVIRIKENSMMMILGAKDTFEKMYPKLVASKAFDGYFSKSNTYCLLYKDKVVLLGTYDVGNNFLTSIEIIQ